MNRRSFLAGILASCAAPAIASSGILMPVQRIWTPPRMMMGSVELAEGYSAGYVAFAQERLLQHVAWACQAKTVQVTQQSCEIVKLVDRPGYGLQALYEVQTWR